MSEPLNVLLLSSASNGGNATSYVDHIACFAKHSKHRFYYHNFVYDLKEDFDFSPFDAIVIAHNFWPESMGEQRRTLIRQARAVKILFLQDEYQYIRPINECMAELGINVMFTCVAPTDFDVFYPKSLIPGLREVHGALTGFVPDYFTGLNPHSSEPRPYDVGYRSRVSPFFLGSIGREKQVIAERFTAICAEYGFTSNISVREDDRLYGESWLRFLRSCRTQLGTPSGSSIVDFDGSIIEQEADYRARHPHATYEDVWSRLLKEHDGRHVIDTVSPRFFEYAATGTTMVLHEGFYGGILNAGQHYIPVRKDYSNVTEVVDKIRDATYCRTLADRAYEDLIASGQYSYRSFVARFDEILERNAPMPPARVPIVAAEHYRRQASVYGQALAFDSNGAFLMSTPLGRRLHVTQWASALLLRLPVVGEALRRVGGDPVRKCRLARSAARLAYCGHAARSMRSRALRALLLGTARVPERLFKELLLLGIVKSAQSGKCSWGPPYGVGLDFDEGARRLVILGIPRQTELGATDPNRFRVWADDGFGANWQGIKSALAAGTILRMAIDLSAVYPLQKFGNCTRFFWQIDGRLEQFRSDPDEYFPLEGLLELGVTQAELVTDCIRWALTPAVGPELALMDKLF